VVERQDGARLASRASGPRVEAAVAELVGRLAGVVAERAVASDGCQRDEEQGDSAHDRLHYLRLAEQALRPRGRVQFSDLSHTGSRGRRQSATCVSWPGRLPRVLYALVIATATGLMTGLGVVPYFFRETLPRRVYDAVLGMGAGLMLSAATLGL